MNFIKETGIVYDCIYYGIVALNNLKSETSGEKNLELAKTENYLYKHKGKTVHPDKCLYPLFYNDLKKAPLIEYFIVNTFEVGYCKNSMENFINVLNDKMKFKKFIINYILHNSYSTEFDYSDPDIYKLKVSLLILGYSANTIKSYILLINNFDEYIDKLIEFLNNVYSVAIKCHEQYDKEIQKCFSRLNTKKSIKNICRQSGIDEEVIRNADIAISLIDKYAYITNWNKNVNKAMYIMGIHFDKFFNMSFMGGDLTIMNNF